MTSHVWLRANRIMVVALVTLALVLSLCNMQVCYAEPPLVACGTLDVEVLYEVNKGSPWQYSQDLSTTEHNAYVAGNCFDDSGEVSNIALTVTEPGELTFVYKISTGASDECALYYMLNSPIDSNNYQSAINYHEYASFTGVIDWTPRTIDIDTDDFDENGQATLFISFYRGDEDAPNDSLVAIADVAFIPFGDRLDDDLIELPQAIDDDTLGLFVICGGMFGECENPDHPLIVIGNENMTVDCEINEGLPWYYSQEYSSYGFDAYLAGNSFSHQSNVSNIAFAVTSPGVFSFDYMVSTPSVGSNYALFYDINSPVGLGESREQAANYTQYTDFRGTCDWTNVEFTITDDHLSDGEAVIYIAYHREGNNTTNENMVAIANVEFIVGEMALYLNINGHHHGNVLFGDQILNEAENTLDFMSGDTVTVTAEASPEAHFYGWVGGDGAFLTTDQTVSFVISADTTLTAVFASEGAYAAQRNGMFYTAVGGGLQLALLEAQSDDLIIMLVDHTLDSDVTLPEGARLYIPYSPEHDPDGNEDGVGDSGSYYRASTKIADDSKTYCTLTIGEGVTLTVDGTLIVGGVISYPGQHYQGHTSGWHGKILNNGEIVVSNGGALDCWGLVVGNGSVLVESGGSAFEPFIVYDFAGGWNTAELYLADQSPFKQYAMQNIQNELVIKHDATLYGHCNLWASSKYNKVDITVVGENGMYKLSEGATVTRIYNGGKQISTNQDIGRAMYLFDGGMTLRHLSMPILGVAISTANVDFPIPYNWELCLANGDYYFDGRIKLMPGATLKVEHDAHLVVARTLFVLDGLIQSDMSGKFYPTTQTLHSAGLSGSGQLIVNGNLTVNEGANFGGLVQTESENDVATVEIEAGAFVNAIGVQDGAIGEYDVNTSLFDLPARASIYDFAKDEYSLKRLYPGRVYSSHDDEGWEIDNYTVTYAVNCTRETWEKEIPVVDGKYHNWSNTTVDLNETRTGSWYTPGEIYHNISVQNRTVYADNDSSRTLVSEGDMIDDVYEGGDIAFTVATSVLGGKGYVYRVFYALGDGEAVLLDPDSYGYYRIDDVHDEVTITVTSCKLGDLNLDDKINMSDLLALRRIIAGYVSPTEWELVAANTDRDAAGKVNMSDLLQLRRFIAGYTAGL